MSQDNNQQAGSIQAIEAPDMVAGQMPGQQPYQAKK